MEQYLSLVQDESSVNYLKGIAAMGLGKYDEAAICSSTRCAFRNAGKKLFIWRLWSCQ